MPFRHILPILIGGYCFACPAASVALAQVGTYPNPSPPRPAQPSLDPLQFPQLTLEELSNIEITSASKAPIRAFQAPVAIFVLTNELIRRSGATSIPEALRGVPGVEVARIDGNKWSIGIRGFGSRLSRSVLVLVDGRTVYTTFFAGTYWEVQDTPMDDIERIEVIRGPGGTIWGPNAVNGVINVITKHSKDSRGTQVSTGGGNEEQGFVNVRHGGGNDRGLNYRVYAKGFTRSPEHHADGLNFDDWRSAQAGFRIDWAPSKQAGQRAGPGRAGDVSPGDVSPGDAFTLQGDLYEMRAGERVEAVSYTQPYDRLLSDNAKLSGGNIVGRWARTLTNGDVMQVQTYFDRTNRSEPNFEERRTTFDVDFLHRFHLGSKSGIPQQISWGFGARVSDGNATEIVSGVTFDPLERTDYLVTAFLQDEITLVPERLTLTLGTKLLKTNFARLTLEPTIRLLWAPDSKQSVWAAFTHAVRTPSRVEEDLYISGYLGKTDTGTPSFVRYNANDRFAPEQMNGYETGYRRIVGRDLYLGVASFFNHYHNLLSQDLTGSAFLETQPAPAHLVQPAQLRNGLQGDTKGFELRPEWHPTEWWTVRGGYSYLQMHIVKAPNSGDVGSGPGIEGSSPRHQLTVQTALDLPRRVTLDLGFRYVSQLPGQRVPAYSTGDGRVAWQATKHLEVAVVGQNLLQPSHPEFGGDAGPLVGIKRSSYGKVTWTY